MVPNTIQNNYLIYTLELTKVLSLSVCLLLKSQFRKSTELFLPKPNPGMHKLNGTPSYILKSEVYYLMFTNYEPFSF